MNLALFAANCLKYCYTHVPREKFLIHPEIRPENSADIQFAAQQIRSIKSNRIESLNSLKVRQGMVNLIPKFVFGFILRFSSASN